MTPSCVTQLHGGPCGGTASGHVSPPPGLPKAVYAGTTSLFFTVGNLIKVGPWLALSRPGPELLWLMLACLPSVPLGVWAG